MISRYGASKVNIITGYSGEMAYGLTWPVLRMVRGGREGAKDGGRGGGSGGWHNYGWGAGGRVREGCK